MKKVILLVVVCVLAVGAFAGCAARAPEGTAAMAPQATAYPEESVSEAAYDMDVAPAEAAATQESGLGGLPNVNVPDTSRKLVYNASFSINSKQFDADYASIKNALATVGGYIENENTYSNNTEYGPARYSYLILRVPVAKYNDFLDTISGVGTVTNKQVTTEDISSQYYDMESRIEILEMQRDRLLGYLEAATKMEDIIKLENELSDVLYELDQYKGSKRHMDGMVDFSAVSVEMNEVLTPQLIAGSQGEEPAGQRASDAFSISMANVGLFLQNVGIFFAAAAPILFLIAGIVAAVFLVRKLALYLRGKRKGKPGQA